MHKKIVASLLRRLEAKTEPVQRSFSANKPAHYAAGPACQVENIGGLYEKYLGIIDDGFYVEIGAFDGVSHSNTIGLARRGWYGLVAEPNPLSAAKLRKNYEHFSRISIEELAIGQSDGEVLQLHIAGTLSSTSQRLIAHYGQLDWASGALGEGRVDVESLTLDSLLKKYSPHRFDLLVVDVEGSEKDVFSGFSLDVWRPTMIVVELTENHPDFQDFRGENAQIFSDLLSSGHVPIFKDSINTVFVEDSRFRERNMLQP
jgi:FkbM family methyltransferase